MTPPVRSGALVIGDLMLDVIAAPDPPDSVDVLAVNYVNGRIDFKPGGTGLSMANAAGGAGWRPVYLLHNLSRPDGPNGWISEILRERLRLLGIASITSFVADADPGVAVIGYFGGGRRMMFGSPGANRLPLSTESVHQACAVVPEVEVVLVSGYMLFRASTEAAVLRVMSQARMDHVPVVLDIVPHSVARNTSLQHFERILADVSFMSCEMNTLLTFYGEAPSHQDRDAVSWNVLNRVLNHVEGVLVYPEFRRYRIVSRSGLLGEGTLGGAVDAVDRRGLADQFLMTVVQTHFLRSYE
jgi:sugar/nucleoside kinase (ribokinase family)